MTSASPGRRGELAGLQAQLSQRDHQILLDVARFRLAAGRQLQQLHFGDDENAARAARRHLIRLTTGKFLVRLPRAVGGLRAGSSGFVYALGVNGNRVLGRATLRGRARDVGDGFLHHTLALTEIYVGLVSLQRQGRLEILQVTTEPRTWQQLGGLTRTDWLKPDLRLVIGVGDEERHSYVEWDRGTEHAPTLLRKLRQYETAYRDHDGDRPDAVFPKVVWLVPSHRRADRLQRMVATARGITRELHVVGLHDDALPLLSGLPPSAAHEPRSTGPSKEPV